MRPAEGYRSIDIGRASSAGQCCVRNSLRSYAVRAPERRSDAIAGIPAPPSEEKAKQHRRPPICLVNGFIKSFTGINVLDSGRPRIVSMVLGTDGSTMSCAWTTSELVESNTRQPVELGASLKYECYPIGKQRDVILLWVVLVLMENASLCQQ
eukprot:scaffold2224_cov167-Cylindrotheca_fusiformis.AAC.4